MQDNRRYRNHSKAHSKGYKNPSSQQPHPHRGGSRHAWPAAGNPHLYRKSSVQLQDTQLWGTEMSALCSSALRGMAHTWAWNANGPAGFGQSMGLSLRSLRAPSCPSSMGIWAALPRGVSPKAGRYERHTLLRIGALDHLFLTPDLISICLRALTTPIHRLNRMGSPKNIA